MLTSGLQVHLHRQTCSPICVHHITHAHAHSPMHVQIGIWKAQAGLEKTQRKRHHAETPRRLLERGLNTQQWSLPQIPLKIHQMAQENASGRSGYQSRAGEERAPQSEHCFHTGPWWCMDPSPAWTFREAVCQMAIK